MNVFDLKNILQEKLNKDIQNLTPYEINLIEDVLQNTPPYLELIVNNINEIMSYGKIDLHEFPQLIFLIINISNSKDIIESKLSDKDNFFIFIKFIIDSLIESEFVYDFNRDYIIKIANSSIDLAKYNYKKIENTNYCNFLSFVCKCII